jgi:hypothetical protein
MAGRADLRDLIALEIGRLRVCDTFGRSPSLG